MLLALILAGFVTDQICFQLAVSAKGLLKGELKRRNLGYRELAERLTAMGVPESERNLANKISRGSFTAAFLLQCMSAMGVDTLRLDHLPKPVES